MFVPQSFRLDISHFQIAVFDRSLERPFNYWTQRHVAQGFAWRPGSAAFATLEEGPHHVSVTVTPADADISWRVVRAVQVPFRVPLHGEIEIASIADSVPLRLPSHLYALRFECWVGGPESHLKLTFMKVDRPTFEILRSNGEVLAPSELLLDAAPA